MSRSKKISDSGLSYRRQKKIESSRMSVYPPELLARWAIRCIELVDSAQITIHADRLLNSFRLLDSLLFLKTEIDH